MEIIIKFQFSKQDPGHFVFQWTTSYTCFKPALVLEVIWIQYTVHPFVTEWMDRWVTVAYCAELTLHTHTSNDVLVIFYSFVVISISVFWIQGFIYLISVTQLLHISRWSAPLWCLISKPRSYALASRKPIDSMRWRLHNTDSLGIKFISKPKPCKCMCSRGESNGMPKGS